MKNLKVVLIQDEMLTFENGVCLYSEHDQDCCESHYLSFKDLTMDDFSGLEFDLTTDDFFERIDGYGIALKPLVGHPIRIAGYGYNNGYYSSSMMLVIGNGNTVIKHYDISDCQVIDG